MSAGVSGGRNPEIRNQKSLQTALPARVLQLPVSGFRFLTSDSGFAFIPPSEQSGTGVVERTLALSDASLGQVFRRFGACGWRVCAGGAAGGVRGAGGGNVLAVRGTDGVVAV